jgi:hypothetical protein
MNSRTLRAAEALAADWWGKPMHLHDAVRLGLQAGLTLQDCPLLRWYTTQNAQKAA